MTFESAFKTTSAIFKKTSAWGNYLWKKLKVENLATLTLSALYLTDSIFFLCVPPFSGAGVVSGTLHPAEWDTHRSS
jgi:hypothetical protein